MNLFIGFVFVWVGFVQFAVARDKRMWVSYAVESFRYCLAFGQMLLGLRFLWIQWFGDEPGVSLWAQCALLAMAVGQFGLQMNNLSHNTLHVPKFLRRRIE